MNIEQERAAFEAWCRSVSLPTDKDACGDYIYVGTHAPWLAWQARAALQSQDREDAATEATGGHRLVEPDHETAMALADAPRSLRNYVAALRSAIALQSQDKEDAERYRCLSSMATQQADSLGPIFRIDVRRTTPQTMFNFDAAVDHARRAEGGRG